MGSPPKVRFTKKPTPIGSTLTPVRPTVEDWSYEGLFVSESHRRLPGNRWSGGGPFYTWQRSALSTGARMIPVSRAGVDKGVYTALGVVGIPNGTKAPAAPPSAPAWADVMSGLSGQYATGYKKARPGNPEASVGQFIAELRDLPALPLKGALLKGKPFFVFGPLGGKHAFATPTPFRDIPRALYGYLKSFRNLGSEYLNQVFGWFPFVNDVRKMINLYHSVDKRMAQIRKENGKNIRRKATIRNDTSSSQTVTIYEYPYANVLGAPGEIDSPGRTQYKLTTTTKTKTWFVGSFRYYLFDPSPSPVSDARMKLALFGALPTPELLWEVMPWSWLIDWFSNVGDVMSNASPNAVDNLTSRYSFVMEHITETIEASAHVSHGQMATSGRQWPSLDNTFKTTVKTESKARLGGGNPFGLGVQLSSLSGRQLGILAALGLSRSSVR